MVKAAVQDELSPLIAAPKTKDGFFPPIRRVFIISFLISMSFAFTQTPLIYAFRIMTCDEYYKTHDWRGAGDRCAVKQIEAETAKAVALVAASTTAFTIINVFVTSWWIKRFGVKAALFQQTVWAAARNLTQIYAQTIGGRLGVTIIQSTQVFNIMGSGGGCALATNAYIAVLANAHQRTALFGMLGGVQMLGAAAGFILGGLAYRYVGTLAPFQIAFAFLCMSTLSGLLFLPFIAPQEPQAVGNAQPKSGGLLQPLKLFLPRKVDVGGKLRRDWNLTLLGAGAFFSVFATGYVTMALQLVGTNVFGFQPTESGIMLSWALLMKAFFLSICFPRIISFGRAALSRRTERHISRLPAPPAIEDRPDDPAEADLPAVTGNSQEELARAPTDVAHGSTFDLIFLQWSIFLDGILTSGVAMSSQGWHMYLAATVLPFASGTGPAAKGVALDFVPAEDRSDALSGIALIEKLAFISTTGVFGYAFSYLSEKGHPMFIFLANAAVAMVGFLLLIPVRMPRQGQIAI